MTRADEVSFAVDVEMTYEVDQPAEMLLLIEVAGGPDQFPSMSTLFLDGAERVVRSPAEGGVGERVRFSVDQTMVCRYRTRASVTRSARTLDTLDHTPITALPDDTLRYLMPSRYCAPSHFTSDLEARFGDLQGGSLIQSMCDWLFDTLRYVPGVSSSDTTATDTFSNGQGVCRDFAHVLIAMARARGIPARFVSCYTPDVTPQDFHAVAEVWLQGKWHIVDPTKMAHPSEVARIGVGLDAAEVAFLTIFGRASMIYQRVATKRET